MKTSLLCASETLYAARISEYARPPATKTITRCRGSLTGFRPLEDVHCGLALRKEPEVDIVGRSEAELPEGGGAWRT